MSFPTTIEAITPAFLTTVVGRPVTAVSATPLGEPYTSLVAALDILLADGGSVRWVAKVGRPDRASPILYAQEVRFYRDVARRLDCVPRPWFAEMADDGGFLLLLDRAGGRHVREGLDLATAKRALAAIAVVHGACCRDEALQASLPHRVHRAEAASRLVQTMHASWDDVAARFPRHLAVPPPIDDLPDELGRLATGTLTHNDLHAENVLVDGDRVVFVDWQNATWSTPMVDVANLVQGCVRPSVQGRAWRELLAHYEAALVAAGGPALPDLVHRYATATGLLFGWMMRYLADVSDAEASERSILLAHWERVCAGVVLPR